jgi:hypothetical protein
MSLGKSLTVGDTVHYFRRSSIQPVAAIVTAITPSGANRQVSLTAFPQGAAPESVANVQHASLTDLGTERWDWPGSAVAL